MEIEAVLVMPCDCRCRHRRVRRCAYHCHAPPLLCARHYALVIVFWWLFPFIVVHATLLALVVGVTKV